MTGQETTPTKSKQAFYTTVVLLDGKRFQTKKDQSPASAKSEAKGFLKDGYEYDVDGVWTFYAAEQIAKVTVIAATD